jgi:predicted phosphodiesterase
MKKLLFVTLTILLIWFGGCKQARISKALPPPPQVQTPVIKTPAPAPATAATIPAPTPVYANITKGPVLLRAYQHTAAIMWESDSNTPQQIRCGAENSSEQAIISTPEKVEYGLNKQAFIHKVWLENLQPGQVYNYSIAAAAPGNKTYYFRTIPADTNEVTFVVYGDSRTNPAEHRRIIEQIIKKNPDFVIHTGDLVTNGNNYDQWGKQYFEPIKGLAEHTPIYITKGNHEGKNGNFEKLLIPQGEKKNFGFQFGPLYYYLADNCSEDLTDKELLNRIVENVHSAKAEWKFVSFHIPALNFSGHNSKWCYPNALPLFAKAGADFVISGHSHIYERFKPVAPPIHSGAHFVTYITSGGGGAPLVKKPKPSNFYAAADSILHFCLFKIKGNMLTLDTIDADGNVIDHLEISKTEGKLNKEYLQTSAPMAEVLAEQRVRKESMMQ